MGKADLHLHTTASDGMMSPAMLMNYIAACTDLDLVAITDHNTMEGWERAREFQHRSQNDHLHHIELVPGIEVSSREGHVLGIGISRAIPRYLSAAAKDHPRRRNDLGPNKPGAVFRGSLPLEQVLPGARRPAA